MARGNRTSKGGHPKPRTQKIRLAINVLPETQLFLQYLVAYHHRYMGDLIYEWSYREWRKIRKSKKAVTLSQSFRKTIRLILERDVTANKMFIFDHLNECQTSYWISNRWMMRTQDFLYKVWEKTPIDVTWIRLPRMINAPKLPRIEITIIW